MEFDNIYLSPFVVAGLYKHTLVLLDDDITVGKWGAKTSEGQSINANEPVVAKLAPAENVPTTPIINKTPPTNITNQPTKTIAQPLFAAEQTVPSTPVEIKNQPVAAPQSLAIKYLGGFGKKISIVVEDHFNLHINDGDLAFLSKLLQACQLSLNDVAIINVVSNKANANQLWQLMPSEKMIIFEVDPGTLGLPFRLSHFKLQPWSDCVFLASPSLETLQAGTSEQVVQLKRSLWESLKKMFLV